MTGKGSISLCQNAGGYLLSAHGGREAKFLYSIVNKISGGDLPDMTIIFESLDGKFYSLVKWLKVIGSYRRTVEISVGFESYCVEFRINANSKLSLFHDSMEDPLVCQLTWPSEEHFAWEDTKIFAAKVIKRLKRRKSWPIVIHGELVQRKVSTWI